MTNCSPPAASLGRLPIELLELIFSFLDPRTLASVAQVNGDCAAASESVCRTKCCDNIPADIFLELWEECGRCQPVNYIKVDNSACKSSIRRFVITEKAPTRAFSHLRHY